LCPASHRNIALHRLAQRFFDPLCGKLLFKCQPLQNGPVEMC
jgi:hypothetical protein